MLFNSFEFLVLFLPAAVGGFHALRRRSPRGARTFLAAASLLFYAVWAPAYLALLVGSMVANYRIGAALRARPKRRGLLAAGVTANLALLGYYKYAGLAVTSAASLLGRDWAPPDIVLPLAISFFTFQQIAYLVDAAKGVGAPPSFADYALFVTFFPQLIAGPIVHHSETTPQFARQGTRPIAPALYVFGVATFSIGLFKKVVLADGFALYADPGFATVATGVHLDFFAAWECTLAYTLQLYFDFSGYSDMAIGIAALFGIVLPLNFHAPYKATNIIEFWRRWHITLSRFLRDYLYIPLGGNRRGSARRYGNLMATMLLGGLWHGAGWNFALWGGLHGAYLCVNHGWRRFTGGWALPTPVATFVTFLAVTVSWVPFRATSWAATESLLQSLAGNHGGRLPQTMLEGLGVVGSALAWIGVRFTAAPLEAGAVWIVVGLLLVFAWPTTQQVVPRPHAPEVTDPTFDDPPSSLTFAPTLGWACLLAILALVAVARVSRTSAFLYFQF